MATLHSSGASAPRNTVVSIEPQQVTVRPDYDAGGILIEIVDRDGRGFNSTLDQPTALDVVLQIGGAIARLRGWGDQS